MSNKHRYGEMVTKQRGPLVKGTAPLNKQKLETHKPPSHAEKSEIPSR